MERQARARDGPGQGLRLERRDLWQPVAGRQGDDWRELERPSVLRLANGQVRAIRHRRSKGRGLRGLFGWTCFRIDQRRPTRRSQRIRSERLPRRFEHCPSGLAMRPERSRTSLRCAVYTRVSTEHGLEQEFNSLDNQREASEAYIKSQAHEGWRLIRNRYDDGGFSGGSRDRPALRKLLDDVRAKRVEVIVVYKVDRLTRSLADFAKLVELFDAHQVSFVSVTQAFNTTNSMGRLTLNVLLSFAQFEREVTGERIRDKIAASKKKGMWMGGQPSLGYDVKDRKLVVNEAEAATVRHIFRRYLELGTVRALRDDLAAGGVVSKRRTAADGSPYGGQKFSRGALYLMLKNRIYRGEIVHKGKASPGEHAAIVDEDLWRSVQGHLEENRLERREGDKALEPSRMAGIVFDASSEPM